jgi:hypothetical protein
MKRSNLIYVIFNLFILINIFDIFLRGLSPNIGNFLNVVKVVVPLFLLCLATFLTDKKKVSNLEKSIFILFIIFYFIFFIKTFTFINSYSFQEFYYWLEKNNNINFLYVFVFFISMRKLDMNIYLSKNCLIFINFIVVLISIYGFITGEYFNTVSQQGILEYAWVGTNKSRMMGVFGSPNHAGLYFVLMLFILDYFTLKEKKRFFNISNLILCTANILTFSRTSIIIMIVYLILRNKIMNVDYEDNKILNFLKKYRLMITIFILIVIVAVLISKFNIYFFSLKYLFVTTRTARWKIGINYMLDYFILGTPYYTEMIDYTEEFGMLRFSDNFIIELGAQFGIIIFTFALIIILYVLFRSLKHKNYLELNKIQFFIISSMLSGTIHFSVPLFLFIVYVYITENIEEGV